MVVQLERGSVEKGSGWTGSVLILQSNASGPMWPLRTPRCISFSPSHGEAGESPPANPWVNSGWESIPKSISGPNPFRTRALV